MASYTRMPALVLLVLLVSMAVAVAPSSAAPLDARTCKLLRTIGLNACKGVLYGNLPSPQCCYRVRKTPWQCVCPIITRKLAQLVDVNRAVRLVEGCGRQVPRHFKCGSITTP